jgi:hypothetical protein
MGSTVGFAMHSLLPPHRSATQIDRPSRSISMALTAPNDRPSGSLKWFSMVRYGLGSAFVGLGPVCAKTAHPPATPAMTAVETNQF